MTSSSAPSSASWPGPSAPVRLGAVLVSLLLGSVFGLFWRRRRRGGFPCARSGGGHDARAGPVGGTGRTHDMVTARSFVRPARLLLACGLSLTLLAACSGDDDSSSSTVALPTAPSTTTTEASATSSSTSPATTSPPETTELNPPPTITDPPTTTTTMVPLPPVSTLVPKCRRPAESRAARPNNVNNSRPILPEHLPAIEAHLLALQATTRASSTWPLDPDAPEPCRAAHAGDPSTLPGGKSGSSRAWRGAQRPARRHVPALCGRPVTDTAVVMDCELAGHYWVKVDTGELVPPDEVWPAGPGHIVEVGLRQTLVLRDGRWLIASSEVDPGACG